MAVFNTIEEKEHFKNALRKVYSRNEAPPEKWYLFSDAGTTKSTWSFGQIQWDVRGNPQAVAILKSFKDSEGNDEFNDSDINKLSNKETMAPGDLGRYNEVLKKHKAEIDGYFEQHLNNDAQLIEDVVAELRKAGKTQVADYISSNPLIQIMLVDYNNQLSIGGVDTGGSIVKDPAGCLMDYLKGNPALRKKIDYGTSFELTDLLRYIFETKYAYNFKDNGAKDLLRRYIHNIEVATEYYLIDIPQDQWSIATSLVGLASLKLSSRELLKIIQQLFGVSKKVQSPIALDLDGDGIETVNINEGGHFDHDANDFAEQTGWVGSGDGLLVYDRNNDGVIDTGRETFGNTTLLSDGTPADNGFQVLAELDENKDGKIDSQDAIWSSLKIWQDYDGDGYSSGDELWSLSDVGVSSINTGYMDSTYIDPQGNEHRQVGSFTRADGTSGTAADVWFQVNKAFTIADEWLDVPEDIAVLPDLQGYGNIYDLHQAMVRDTSGGLKTLVEGFVAGTDPNIRSSLMEQIILKWTGCEGIDPGSRGPNIDAKELSVLEKLFADEFLGWGGEDPTLNAGTILNHCYKGIFEMYYADLLAQTHLKGLYNKIAYTWDETTQSLKGDLSSVITTLQGELVADPAAGKAMLGEFARSLRGFQMQNMIDYWGFRSVFAGQSEELSWAFDSGGHNIVTGGGAARGFCDAIQGGDGNDNLLGDCYNFYFSTSGVLYGGAGNDTLTGNNGSDLLVGGAGNDTLLGEYIYSFMPGGDIFDGGPGNDSLQGGKGNDIYLFDHGYGEDTIEDFDTTSGNVDTLKFALDIVRSDVEITRNWNTLVFRIKGTTDQVLVPSGITKSPRQLERIEFGDGTVLTGDEVTLISEEIRGTPGNDTITGSAIRDRIYAEAGNDAIYGSGGDDLIEGGPGNDTLLGDYYQISGYEGNDTLDGGSGDDSLQGSLGNDTYLLGRGYGTDTILDYDATPGNVDTLRFKSDVLPGDIKASTDGWHLYFSIEGTGDSIKISYYYFRSQYWVEKIEFSDGTMFSVSDVRLGTAGNNSLSGTDSDTIMMGYDGIDTLDGGGGNDLINGGTGADTMKGGPGNDTFVVDNADDTVIEEIDAGTDNVWSSVSYVLGSNVENLTLIGTEVVNGTGNELDNVLTGNSAANVLTGREGNDTYIIGPGDTVIENQDEGIDTIASSETLTLPSNIENLTLTGSGNNNATGNALDNLLDGNNGDNVLDGSPGADIMRGGPGNDTYVVENEGDSVIEDPNQGTDTVLSSIHWTLGSNVENLTLIGNAKINARGNDLNNILIGNTASNLLIGASGDDTLAGGLGDDFLEGGIGNDLYLFGRGYGQERIADDDGGDTLRFASDVGRDDMEIIREGDDVIFRIKGTSDQVTIPEWMTKPSNRLEAIQFGDEVLLSGDDVTDLFKEIRGTSGDDDLIGTSGTDRIYGLEGDDLLNGCAGDDLLVGGLGNDTYVIDSIGDAVSEAPNEGTDTVQSSIDYTLGENLEKLTLLSGADHGTGNELNNLLVGNGASNVLEGAGGDDTLDGGGEADTLIGGPGNDTYFVDDPGDVVTEEPNQGVDTVLSSITYTLGPNLENFILTGTDSINGAGNELDNILIGNSNSNSLDGKEGADEMIGGAGDDTYIVGFGDTVLENPDEGIDTVQISIDYTLGQNIENLILTASAKRGTGNELNNTFIGNSGTNILDGRAGADWMYGGEGDDVYIVDNVSDKVMELSSEGIDSVESSVTYVLDKEIENLILTGTGSISGTGNDLDNTLTGNSETNILVGGLGNDTYIIGFGDTVVESEDGGVDTIFTAGAFMLPSNVENGTLTGTTNADVAGNELDNALIGNGGVNTIDGGGGADTMMGGGGNDTYFVDTLEDCVFENVNEGIDTIRTPVDWTLGPNIENLTLFGTAVNGFGNELENVLIGNGADNVLDGGGGADILIGGLGNDTYFVDNERDFVTEFVGDGRDIIFSSIDYTLVENIEDMTLTEDAAVAIGNDLNNVLAGNSAPNELRGGKGDDTYIVGTEDRVLENQDEGIDLVQSSIDWTLEPNVENLTLVGTDAIDGTGNELCNTLIGNSAPNILAGGFGDDTYMISLGDAVVENANEGIDRILSAETLILPANVENGTLTGTTDTNVTGNGLDNLLIGNGGSNIIDGKTGADTMAGGLGDDIYMVDNCGDIVTEAPNEGIDTVQSSTAYTLAEDVENLILTGNDWIHGTGNELNNMLTGNSSFNILRGEGGDDVLDGGGGIDILMGGLGNDTYVVSRPWDVVVEGINEGVDTVESSINYTLGPNVENLILTGNAMLGNGNHLDNELKGNASSNLLMGHKGNDKLLGREGRDDLRGGAGEDILDGGPGDDMLKGEGHSDTYLFGRGYGHDTISEQGEAKQAGEMDRARFVGLNLIDLIFVKDGKDLDILINGSDDFLTIENQNQRSGPQVEIFETFDGQRLMASEINLLIQEMAGFSKQTGMSWTQLIQERTTDLQQILAHHWQQQE